MARFADRRPSSNGREASATVAEVEAAFHRDLVRTIRERTGRRVAAWQEAARVGRRDTAGRLRRRVAHGGGLSRARR